MKKSKPLPTEAAHPLETMKLGVFGPWPSVNLHHIVDGVAALAILVFVVLEHGLKVKFISDSTMTFGDAGLHVLIFSTLAWHFLREKLRRD